MEQQLHLEHERSCKENQWVSHLFVALVIQHTIQSFAIKLVIYFHSLLSQFA